MAEEICRRLHFSNEDTKQIAALVANHMRFADAERMKESTLKRFMRLPKFDEHLELHRMDCLSSHGNLSLYDFVRERLERQLGGRDQAGTAADRSGPDPARLQARPGVPRDPVRRGGCATGRNACTAGKRRSTLCGANSQSRSEGCEPSSAKPVLESKLRPCNMPGQR